MKKLAAASVMGVALLGATASALEDAPFTVAQATAGRTAYAASCAVCHGPQLRGAGEAPGVIEQILVTAQ